MRIIALIILLMAACCGEQGSNSRPSEGSSNDPSSIGPQFWVYDLAEYDIVNQDVVTGLGGPWLSIKYNKKPEATVSRDILVSRITSALTADGWSRTDLPQRKYVLSTIWEKSSEDLHFTRAAKKEEPVEWFFSQTIHINKDASTLCLYCEVGW